MCKSKTLDDNEYEMGWYKWNILQCTENKLIMLQNDQWRLLATRDSGNDFRIPEIA